LLFKLLLTLALFKFHFFHFFSERSNVFFSLTRSVWADSKDYCT
jgi:hypothetical protein